MGLQLSWNLWLKLTGIELLQNEWWCQVIRLKGCNDRALGCKYVLLLKREKWTRRRFKHDHEHWFSYDRLNVFDQEWCYPHNECRRQAIEPEDDSWISTYNFVFFFADLGFAWELSPLPSNLIFFYLEVECLFSDYFIITLEVRYNLSFHRKKEVLLQDESFH